MPYRCVYKKLEATPRIDQAQPEKQRAERAEIWAFRAFSILLEDAPHKSEA
jgi:hypothetical protein